MSQAEELLNSIVEDEHLSGAGDSERHIVIGRDRSVMVPEELQKIGVQYDHNIETVTFDCPRYWDKHDMSEMIVYINFMREDGYVDKTAATNVVVDDEDDQIMHFDWTISGNATMVKGNLRFLVCIKKTDAEGNEENHWNSDLNNDMYITEGLECDSAMITKYPDIITDILTRMERCEAILDMTWVNATDKKINDIIGGITVVGRAEMDGKGNVIHETSERAQSARQDLDDILSGDTAVPKATSADYDPNGNPLNGLYENAMSTQSTVNEVMFGVNPVPKATNAEYANKPSPNGDLDLDLKTIKEKALDALNTANTNRAVLNDILSGETVVAKADQLTVDEWAEAGIYGVNKAAWYISEADSTPEYGRYEIAVQGPEGAFNSSSTYPHRTMTVYFGVVELKKEETARVPDVAITTDIKLTAAFYEAQMSLYLGSTQLTSDTAYGDTPIKILYRKARY